MKYFFKTILVILFISSINLCANENDKGLHNLAKQLIEAVKINDLDKFKACWVEPDIMVDYSKLLFQHESKNQDYTKIMQYFIKSRKKIQPFYTTLQKRIKKYGLNHQDIIYKSSEYKLKNSEKEGYYISSMKINFYFSSNPSKTYNIIIDDAFKIYNKTWLFTDKPLRNIQVNQKKKK